MSLLSSALSIPRKRRGADWNPEELELALAWLQGKITAMQATKASGLKNHSSWYFRVSVVLQRAMADGAVLVQLVPKSLDKKRGGGAAA